jgi:hypothetical protein
MGPNPYEIGDREAELAVVSQGNPDYTKDRAERVLECKTLDAAPVVRVSGESRKQAPTDDPSINATSTGDGAVFGPYSKPGLGRER